MTELTESYWPAEQSIPLRDLTVGDLLREAAADSPVSATAWCVNTTSSIWGEQVAAFVRCADGAAPTPAELAAHVRAELAAFKAPRTWVFVDAFPLTGSGKIQKFVLREQYLKGELTAASGG